ncbi:hypothetical protein Nepgr_014816 [Nepenthes gracilis]|uniref:Uncharacterized protein n=1 Tax=Nepenthes gracilis TaxID=150966 RepID=A0AAD3XQV2_NEPGR|nr:hypothetical protein Nepgr_014816 [Nepenthes gracilis]
MHACHKELQHQLQCIANLAPKTYHGFCTYRLAYKQMQLSIFKGHYQETKKCHSKCQESVSPQQDKTADPNRVQQENRPTSSKTKKGNAQGVGQPQSIHQIPTPPHLIQRRAYNGFKEPDEPSRDYPRTLGQDCFLN